MSAALSISETRQAIPAGAVAVGLPPELSPATAPLRRKVTAKTVARHAQFLALVGSGCTVREAARRMGVHEKHAANYRRDLAAQGIDIAALIRRANSAAARKRHTDKAATRYARLAPLLREHLAAGNSANSFAEAHGVAYRTVGRLALAHGIDLPKPGPRAMAADLVLAASPVFESAVGGSCAQIVFTRRCPDCQGIFQRAGLSLVSCDPCLEAAA
jgi:transposase